ncbi:MAG: tryptophan--tRNA ligase [Thermomicrobiaceae bacterium]
MASQKPRVFSGIQPTGGTHIGNYLGAIRNWVDQQDQYDNIFCIVDLHAITMPYTAADLRERKLDMAKILLASGIDPDRSILFMQSDVREHSELAWILGTQAMFGELRRMTQFKEKSGGGNERVGVGVFTYPVLQAADIVLYDAEKVPVGEDQKQHLELTRDITLRFNAQFGETFVVPEPDIKEVGARIMSLDDPHSKMSKSNPNAGSRVELRDTPDQISKKIRRAVTDSGSEVRYDEVEKPAVANLMNIYSLFARVAIKDVEERYAGKGYGDFKKDLAELVVEGIRPIQERILELDESPDEVVKLMEQGRQRAHAIAEPKMKLVRDVTGLTFTTE